MRTTLLACLMLLLVGCSTQTLQPPLTAKLPIKPGDIGPVAAANPLQYPFSCTTEQAGLGEPIIDSEDAVGQPVYSQGVFKYTLGYSRYCGAPMQVSYFYRNGDGKFIALPKTNTTLPTDVAMIDYQGQQIPFVVRLERGVLNRFIFGVSSLTQWPLQDDVTASTLWNKRLVMLFLGGVGLGHHQSGGLGLTLLGKEAEKNDHPLSMFNPDLLQKGYVIAGSTGMSTDTSYNLPLLAQTADMLKQQVSLRYGKPDFTLGMGGSGGAIQQIYNAKQYPQMLDAMLASHLFPDLLTQITGVGDCELLQYYFDRGASEEIKQTGFWRNWQHRQLIEGFNAIPGYPSRYSIDGTGTPMMADAEPGSSVCVEGWRGVTPVVFNPRMFLPFLDMHQVWLKNDAELLRKTQWSHWDDTREIYGVDAQGFALRTYDNVGVQYGLQALTQGQINVQQFLDLNARVGGWKAPAEMQMEYAPFYPYGLFALNKTSVTQLASANIKLSSTSQFFRGVQNAIPLLPDETVSPKIKRWFGRSDKQSVWSHHNATATSNPEIAPRSLGSEQAIDSAIKAGMVFDGIWKKPAISLMIYNEDKLDIHDARQSFVFRQRMLDAGSASQQFSIWGLMPSGNDSGDKRQLGVMAFAAITELDQWLSTGKKPKSAEDACWGDDYQLLARGDNRVWKAGQSSICRQHFPVFGSPRTAAGEPIVSELLKCPLKPVSQALADGTYAGVAFSEVDKQRLQQVFAEGVCDYR